MGLTDMVKASVIPKEMDSMKNSSGRVFYGDSKYDKTLVDSPTASLRAFTEIFKIDLDIVSRGSV